MDIMDDFEMRVRADKAVRVLQAVWLYDEDEECRRLVDESADYGVYAHEALRKQDASLHAYGEDYARAVAPGLADEPMGLVEGVISRMPEERRGVYQAEFDRLQLSGRDTRQDYYGLYGRIVRDEVREEYGAHVARLAERRDALTGLFGDIVAEAQPFSVSNENWRAFHDGLGRGVYTDEDEAALNKAVDAWSMMMGMAREYTDASANVLADAAGGRLIMDRLRGDELAEALFFNQLQKYVQDQRTSEADRNFFVRFWHAFEAADKTLLAGMFGGGFRAFVTDDQVEDYNREWERAREISRLENPNVPFYAEGDNWAEKYLGLQNARLGDVLRAARASGQLNEDGSLRKMTEEERRSTQELNAFRGKLYNATQGMYDIDGFAAKFGKMLPDSMIYLVPGGIFASAGSMYTRELAQRMGEGASWTEASNQAVVNSAIQATVERIAFGSLKPGRMVRGMDWLMSRQFMARSLGGFYSTTGGRIAMGMGLGTVEETFAEPLAALLLGGVYNTVASKAMQLDNPYNTFVNEMEEMLSPDQLMATALYSLLLMGGSYGGQKAAAENYRQMRDKLIAIGVDEGRAAQVARMENPQERMVAAQALIQERLKSDAGSVLSYVAELYPQMQGMATFENYFDKGQLPRLIPAGDGQVRVQEREADGTVTETVVAETTGRALVEARLEQLSGKEQLEFADMVLANAMVGSLSKDGERWVVSPEGQKMNHEYFQRLARAAGLRLSEGARPEDVDPEVHPHIPLGQLAQQGEAWEARMKVARHDYEQKKGKPVSDEEWGRVSKRFESRVNRTGVRGADKRLRTVLRVARGKFGAMEVLEDVTEDNLVRDMEANGRSLDYYIHNLRELEGALGKPGAFLRDLKDGETEGDRRMAVIEAMGKLVQSKVLADTASKGNGLSAALNAFLEMIRSWVLQAKAMFKMGQLVNKVLTDKEAAEKLDKEFREDVDRLVAQDVEFLQELQLADGLEAMQRVEAAHKAAAADRRVKRRLRAHTPVLDAAEEKHGEDVRKEQAEKEKTQAEVQADVEAAEAAVDGDFTSSVVNEEELEDIKAAAEKDGTFMKAPNGKPTNLTELQWLQVRTKAFKDWFGDWEKVARFNSAVHQLSRMSDVASITGTEFAPDGRKLTDKVTEFWNKEYGGVAKNPVLGDVVLDTRSVKASIAHGVGRLKSAAFAVVHDVIERGVLVEIAPDWKGRGEDSYVIAAPVQIGNTAYVCEVVVMKGETRTGFYLHEVQIKEKLLDVFKTGVVTGTSGASKSILLDVWQRVKQIEENCSKVVDENGEPRVVYHGSLQWFQIFNDGNERHQSGAPDGTIFANDNREIAVSFVDYYGGNAENVILNANDARHARMPWGVYRKGGIYPLFMNLKNPLVVDFEGLTWHGEKYDIKDVNWYAVEARKKGHDGLIIRNVIDVGFTDTNDVPPSTDYVAFESNQVKSATDNRGTFDGSSGDITMSVNEPLEGDVSFSVRTKAEPKKKGIGYKVFYQKDGKLYPPMVANPGGEDTPVGVWLDADEGVRAGESKTGRPQVKAGGKGTQGGSGTLAYRPGWHLGKIPYALQFNRKNPVTGEKDLFPKDFVWAEVEYAADVDYQEEAMSYGVNKNGKFQYSLAGLPKLPTDGYYEYRTNPNPATDPWIITGAMKVTKVLTRAEVDELVRAAGREPQKVEGDDVQGVSFNVIGPSAANWGKIKHRAFKGRDDGKERVEIDASESEVNVQALEELATMEEAMPLGKLLHYPSLYEAYPRLKDFPVYARDLGEWVNGYKSAPGDVEHIVINVQRFANVAQVRNTLLHEIQHVIQDIEGYARGGSEDSARGELNALARSPLNDFQMKVAESTLLWLNAEKIYKPKLKEYKDALQGGADSAQLERMRKELNDLATDLNIQYVNTKGYKNYWGASEFELPYLGGTDAVFVEFVERRLAKMKSRKRAFPGLEKKMKARLQQMQHEFELAEKLDKLSDFELYLRLAGEIEARNVERRVHGTMEQREGLPFNDSLEYPGEALVTFSVSPTLMADIRSAAYNKMDSKAHVRLCSMPTVLRMLGEPEGDVYTLPGTISKLVYTHNLAHPEVYRAVEELEDPLFVYQETGKTCVFVLEMEATNNKGVKSNVMVAIELERSDSGHYLMSAYPLDALAKIKDLQKQGRLVYSKYTAQELEDAINKQAIPPADNAPSPFKLDLMRSAVKDGLPPTVPTKVDLVKYKDENFDFSASMVNLDEQALAYEVVAAGQGFRANLAFSEQIVREMRGALLRMKKLGSKTATEREDAIAAMGTMVQVVKAAVAYLPQGYRFSVHPYLNKLEVLAELATTGDLKMTRDLANKTIKEWVKLNKGLADVVAVKGQELDRQTSAEELAKEYGEMQLQEAMEAIMHRVAGQLRKHAKDLAVLKIKELVERLAPKKDPKTGKLKGGKMSADAYRDLEDVATAMNMNAEELEAKLAALRAEMETPGIDEERRAQLESEMTLYDQFGDLKSMTAEEAVEALEALRQRVWFHRFEWDNVQAERRAARRAMVRSVVDGVGDVGQNEYNAKKRAKKPTQRLKNLADILSGMPAVLTGLRGYLPLHKLADDLARRANRAGEAIKKWEAERWVALEALSRETLGKSWRKSMDFMHEVLPTGVTFNRPKYRSVSVKTAALRELLAMTPEERRAEMNRRQKAGGLEAESVLTERDIEALEARLLAMEEAGKVLSTVEARYVASVQREENLRLSRGEALYAILMWEQPTYTERMEAQGYTPEVIAGFKRFIGDGMLQFGYGLRELFARQGERIARVYEATFGVPFPREENYFAARWNVTGMKENPAEQLLAGMAGTPGAGNGWMKQRVNHNLELDMTKDALQVFLQATTLTDTWMATQDIVADFKAWTRDPDFDRAMMSVLGKDDYGNLKDWIRIVELGGVQDCLNMGVAQDVINGLYGSGAVAILGFRIQTLLRQLPSIFNGLLGAHDISTGEWIATLSRMKKAEAPMTYKRMMNSTLIQNRRQGKAGNMAGQAMRSNDTASSMTEGMLLASMLPMEWVDASATAMSLVPVWNVYYQRAIDKGASVQEAEQAAWEQTAIVANLSAQPIGVLNKSKVLQSRNPLVKAVFYMLSENMAKVAMCRALWRGGKKKAALRAWLIYGAANAAISALLDFLQGDPDEWEKGNWWEYMLSAFYGPMASIPGVGEMLEGLGTVGLNVAGEALDVEWMKRARMRASVGRALIDVQGSRRAVRKLYEFMTDNKEHSLAEYTRAISTVSRTAAISTGWLGNSIGFWSTTVAVLMNPIDFGARVWRNMKHYFD